jgi:protein disulfide-isomerase A6
MIIVFLSLVRGEYIEVTSKIIDKIIGGPRPVFVKFYSPYSDHCISIAQDFSDASTRFPTVLFGGLNCADTGDLCDRLGVTGTPLLRFYGAHNRTGLEYDGPQFVDNFVYFIQNQTAVKAQPSSLSRLVAITHATWRRYITDDTCALIMFHTQHCGDCQHIRPQLAQAATVFEDDPNVTIATLNCELYGIYCHNVGVEMWPDYEDEDESGVPPRIRGYARGTWVNYTGQMSLNGFVQSVNRRCGLDRRIDGLLGESAGRIAEADEIAKEFVDADNKDELVEAMKKIDAAGFYVKIMDRIKGKGVEQVKKDAALMKVSLEQRKGSRKTLDAIKKRYNVVNSFFLRAAPKPKAADAAQNPDTDL